ARVGEQHATETVGQEARRGRASVGASHEALGRPCPREPVGVGEVERSACAAPEPGAVQEPELPVVDVEEQRTPTARTREQAETVTRRTRLGRDDEVAVDQREERGQTSDRKSTRLNSSHGSISYAVFCLKKKNEQRLEHECKQNHKSITFIRYRTQSIWPSSIASPTPIPGHPQQSG